MSWGEFEEHYVKAVAGDFRSISRNSSEEAILRLQPGGRWWHAHHRKSQSWLSSSRWELTESLGSWSLESPTLSSTSSPSAVKGVTVVRLCGELRHCASSDRKAAAGHLKGALHHLESLFDDGRLVLRYALHSCPTDGSLSGLVFEGTDVLTLSRELTEAVEQLGFSLRYVACSASKQRLCFAQSPSLPNIRLQDSEDKIAWCTSARKETKSSMSPKASNILQASITSGSSLRPYHVKRAGTGISTSPNSQVLLQEKEERISWCGARKSKEDLDQTSLLFEGTSQDSKSFQRLSLIQPPSVPTPAEQTQDEKTQPEASTLQVKIPSDDVGTEAKPDEMINAFSAGCDEATSGFEELVGSLDGSC